MRKWKTILVNENQIVLFSNISSSYLIAMPNNSEYRGYKFYHPNKLVKHQPNKAYELIYNDEFKFKLIKTDKSYKIVDTINLSADEMEEILPVKKDKYETHKPKELKVENVEVSEELKDE